MDTATIELVIRAIAESGTAEKVAWIWFYAQMIEGASVVAVLSMLTFLGYKGIKAIERS